MRINFCSARILVVTIVGSLTLSFLGRASDQPSLRIASSEIADGAPIPVQFTCEGSDISPQIRWEGAPDGTKAMAMIVDDPDAPVGTFVHWVIFDLSPSTNGLDQAVPKNETLPGGGHQGTNGFGKIGYNGPCPPPGETHHYHFRLFALDREVDPGPRAKAEALEKAIAGHVKGSAELVGTFSR